MLWLTSFLLASMFRHADVLTFYCPNVQKSFGSISFLFTLFHTLLHATKAQLSCFHAVAHSLEKIPGVGGRGLMIKTRQFYFRFSTVAVPAAHCSVVPEALPSLRT